MLTIYLDQNKWIDLARAENGHAEGVDYVETLDVLKRAVDDGVARLPLSAAHYYETGKQGDPSKRSRLAATMLRLAGPWRIAPPHRIVPWEIRGAFRRVFEVKSDEHEIAIFGHGVAHALAEPSLKYVAPTTFEGTELPREIQDYLEVIGGAFFENWMLSRNTPDGIPDPPRFDLYRKMESTDARFVRGQRDVADWIRKLGRHRLEDIMLATALADISEPLMLIAQEFEISADRLADNAGPLLESIASRWVEMKLRRHRQANPQKRWEGNDLNDVTALSIAVPYCDVVVTEKSWSALINAGRINGRFDTIVTPRLREVPGFLPETFHQA